MKTRLIVLFALLAAVCPAQLTTDQRLADFRNLVDLYARRYASIQWKQTALNFDVLNMAPWTAKVSAVTNDLDFYDLMVEYVSDLVDAHDQYLIPSDFDAYLGFSVDIYDGKVLIDFIDSDYPPPASFTAKVGDELVSVDGKSAADLVKFFTKYVSGGNPRSTQRFAAELITDRYQTEYPRAHEVGDIATVVILHQNGATESFDVPWQKFGTALTGLGASPGPRTAQSLALKPRTRGVRVPAARVPAGQQFFSKLHNYSLAQQINVVGFGALAPVFAPPNGFVQRLGKRVFDTIYSGTYAAPDGTKIGFIRIPDFVNPATSDLDKEIKYFQANTDALVVDVMRNPGGSVCLAEEILSRLTTHDFQGTSAELRIDWNDIFEVNQELANADFFELDDDQIAQLKLFQTEFQKAYYGKGNGRTGALPICASTTTRNAVATAYTKPVLVLVDEMSASAADMFAALVQDNHVAPLFGYRTMGAGGSPEEDFVGIYSEGDTRVTRSLLVRQQPVVTPEYPTTSYIENVGVRPETVVDYMTTDNLVNKGSKFVDAFTAAVVKLVKGN